MKMQARDVLLPFLAVFLGCAVSCKSSTQQLGDRVPSGGSEAKASDAIPAATPEAAPTAPPKPAENILMPAERTKGPELLQAGFAAEGRLIQIQFRLPPRKARRLAQGNVYVVNEASKDTYRAVPVTANIGPLIARPRQEGQVGYVMLVNAPVPLKSGAIVTVVLGDYKQEHVRMR
jgi:hypothetical protein